MTLFAGCRISAVVFLSFFSFFFFFFLTRSWFIRLHFPDPLQCENGCMSWIVNQTSTCALMRVVSPWILLPSRLPRCEISSNGGLADLTFLTVCPPVCVWSVAGESGVGGCSFYSSRIHVTPEELLHTPPRVVLCTCVILPQLNSVSRRLCQSAIFAVSVKARVDTISISVCVCACACACVCVCVCVLQSLSCASPPPL